MSRARCVDSPSDFLATSWDEMARNVIKSHFIAFDFQKTFHSTAVFFTFLCSRIERANGGLRCNWKQIYILFEVPKMNCIFIMTRHYHWNLQFSKDYAALKAICPKQIMQNRLSSEMEILFFYLADLYWNKGLSMYFNLIKDIAL